ncbi:MAG TPA: RNA pseudouridine synthase [Clostridia bacterium]|nr:RNA pseudouridine synthase [Clostridia bacterium]
MINILYEDNHILVAEKPANIPVQADESQDPDFLNMLKEYVKEKYNKPGQAYLGLVHRLDRPVAGLMVFARTSKAAGRLSDEIRNGRMEKVYLAIVRGIPEKTCGRLQNWLIKDTKNNKVVAYPSIVSGGKEAVLDYEVLASRNNLSLIKINLLTGRAHQIRAQMAANKTPIYGDRKYGQPEDMKVNTPIALYAAKLSFMHPVRKERMTFLSYPPECQPWDKFDFRLD